MEMNQQTPTPAPLTTQDPVSTKKKGMAPLLPIVLGVLLVGAGAFAYLQFDKSQKADQQLTDLKKQVETLAAEKKNLTTEVEKRKETTGEENIDKESFQSVFLKSGQVYFGKITKLTENQITLTNIYYLRASSTNGTSTTTKADPNNLGGDVSLTKLGNELHGPQDTMYIERKEVEFWENLKNDGQVAKAIKVFEETQE